MGDKWQADDQIEECKVLKHEFEWLLSHEVQSVLLDVYNTIQKCCERLNIGLDAESFPIRQEKLVVASPQGADNVKCIVTLLGDMIMEADIKLKLQSKHGFTYFKTNVHADIPWKLQQIQDCANHLMTALEILESTEKDHKYTSGDEVSMVLNELIQCLHRALTCLVLPRRRTLEELFQSKNMKSLRPELPKDIVLSFYIQGHKLVLTAYMLQGMQKFEIFSKSMAECSVPRLNECVYILSVVLQECQQLKDKLSVFSQYTNNNDWRLMASETDPNKDNPDHVIHFV